MGEATGRFHSLTFGDSKKAKVTRHAASAGGGALATLLLIHQLYGGDIAAVKQNLIDTAVVKESIVSIKESQKAFKEDYKNDMDWIKQAIMAQNAKQGVVVSAPPVPKCDTVIVHFRVPRSDTLAHSFWRACTVYVPLKDTI